MKAAVIVFPGSNCDRDCKVAIERSTGADVAMVWHQDTALPAGVDLVVLPGGFAYGDYLRCGAMAALSPIMADVKAAAERGVATVGICNGFQVLCEAGMLPGALLRNDHLKYNCKAVDLAVVNARGNVLGLMPHPDRAFEAELGSADGAILFQSALASA